MRVPPGLAEVNSGFPFVLPLRKGQQLLLELPDPGLLAMLDPDSVGVAILDHLGFTKKSWGLGKTNKLLGKRTSVLDSDLRQLVVGAMQGAPGAMYLNGVRYHASRIELGDEDACFVLVVDAEEERVFRESANKNAISVEVLKNMGRVLTANLSLQQLCVTAVHEIARVMELAGVLLWVARPQDKSLRLTASVGANRDALNLMDKLDPHEGESCIAELVATTRRSFHARSVLDNPLTQELEARACYLRPGAVLVLPLIVGDSLIGVLEILALEGDPDFWEHESLLCTIAEHLALALKGSLLYENVQHLASFDALTGVANHRKMQEFLAARLHESERTGQEFGVLMLDVDHFRSFNEEEGHDAGDTVLKMVVEAIQGAIRSYDLVARYGGEEFTIILPATTEDGAFRSAERIRMAIERVRYQTKGGQLRPVTASLGGSVFPHTAKDPASLLKAADVALYQAKRSGRNCCRMFEGMYIENPDHSEIEFDRILHMVPAQDIPASEEFARFADAYLVHISQELSLSRTQERLLETLVRLLCTYRRLQLQGAADQLQHLKESPEMRLLTPSLFSVDVRFDQQGKGAPIPLLARILSVLEALSIDDGSALVLDSGRFDPDVLAALANFDRAA